MSEPAAPAAPPVAVRPVVAADLPGLKALLNGLDEQARTRRWFTGAADVHRAVAWAANPECHHAVGLVAAAPTGEVVGHAALVPIDETRAEVCFEVAAPWRHHGVAGLLLDELVRRAAPRGVRTLVAEVLAENADMLAVLREHGSCRERRQGGVLVLELAV
ncbi:MAG: hypothetical protein QOG15_2490 [Solirubrobacteraceae bacterium]|jgi:L-amino acid N-acyltransferase YncA|nr:hypothetical protein [Solirubrobacteraceae bacterium]